MEFVEGPTLGDLLKKKKRLEPGESLRVIRQVLQGLVEAHDLNLVHRDLKPANIMIDKRGQAIILDFGLVRDASGENLTRAGMILGTPRYISPEQVRGQAVDQRSDLYAVGIILYEMLIGHAPFRDQDHMVVLMKHVNEDLSRPETVGVKMDDGLFEIIEKLTRKPQDQRYQNAEEAIEAVENYLVAAGHTSVMRDGSSHAVSGVSGGMTVARPLQSPSSGSLSANRTPTSIRAVRSLSSDNKPVPDEVISELLDLFTEFLGPLARKLAAKDAARENIDLSQVPTVTRRIVYLTDVTEKISLGKLEMAINITGRDEVAKLARALDRMRESVRIAAEMID